MNPLRNRSLKEENFFDSQGLLKIPSKWIKGSSVLKVSECTERSTDVIVPRRKKEGSRERERGNCVSNTTNRFHSCLCNTFLRQFLTYFISCIHSLPLSLSLLLSLSLSLNLHTSIFFLSKRGKSVQTLVIKTRPQGRQTVQIGNCSEGKSFFGGY